MEKKGNGGIYYQVEGRVVLIMIISVFSYVRGVSPASGFLWTSENSVNGVYHSQCILITCVSILLR